MNVTMIPLMPHHIESLMDRHEYMVYNSHSSKNILFIGSCRMAPLMYYYANIPNARNVFCILVYKCIDNLNEQRVREILNHTDIIICENVVSYGTLNTEHTEVNFFKHFNISNTQVIHIPNLDHRIYHYDLKHQFKVEGEDAHNLFMKSREHLKKQCIDKGFEGLWNDIETYIKDHRLFATYNHPTRYLSLMLFKHIVKKIGGSLPLPFYHSMLKHKFLEGNDTPIFKIDIEKYKFTFPVYLVSEDMYETKNVLVHQHPESIFIPNSMFE